MDVLTSETCWALNNEIKKQVTSNWSLFILLYFTFRSFNDAISNSEYSLIVWLVNNKFGGYKNKWPWHKFERCKSRWEWHKFMFRHYPGTCPKALTKTTVTSVSMTSFRADNYTWGNPWFKTGVLRHSTLNFVGHTGLEWSRFCRFSVWVETDGICSCYMQTYLVRSAF